MDSVDPKGLLIGICCFASFVIWLLGRRVDTLGDAFDSLPAAGLAFGALLASPFFFYYSWQQYGAKARLMREGLPVSPAFGHAVGAQGGRPPRGIWRFETLDDPKPILAFYEAAATRLGWEMERKKNGVLLEKSGIQLAVWTEPHGGRQHVILQKTASKPPAKAP